MTELARGGIASVPNRLEVTYEGTLAPSSKIWVPVLYDALLPSSSRVGGVSLL